MSGGASAFLRHSPGPSPARRTRAAAAPRCCSGDKTEAYERKLELLEREEEMIREEQEEAAAVAQELPVTAGAATATEMTAAVAAAAVMSEATAAAVVDSLQEKEASLEGGTSAEERAALEAAAREAKMRKVIR